MNARDLTETALALIVVGGMVGITVYDTILGRPITIPGELLGFGGLVLGSYFRGSATVQALANGTVTKVMAAIKAQEAPSGP